MVCILGYRILLRDIDSDIPGFHSTLQIIFEVLLALFTMVYISFAWGTRKAIPKKIYIGLFIAVAAIAGGQFK